jgi:hypothetical protein
VTTTRWKSNAGGTGAFLGRKAAHRAYGGRVLVDQGNLPEALKSFRDGLAIRDRLAKADPLRRLYGPDTLRQMSDCRHIF